MEFGKVLNFAQISAMLWFLEGKNGFEMFSANSAYFFEWNSLFSFKIFKIGGVEWISEMFLISSQSKRARGFPEVKNGCF